MSTQPLDAPAPDYESQMMLILGKPGGGKGTISGKILKVRGGSHINLALWMSVLAVSGWSLS
jgi:hypothetical protein